MGSGVTIDAVTGILSGTAPATTGPYIVSVCITESRGGVVISVTKKEVMVTVADCSLSAATLNTSYINCDNYTFTFQNESSSSSISSYAWDFGVTTITTDVSSQATPTYIYPDTGTYMLKLKVSNTSGCIDSTTAPVKVYPGFTPSFTVSGSCYQSPFTFTDATIAAYGTVNSWSWSFGETSASDNTSTVQNPTHQYASPATYTVVLDVASSKGCTSTVSKSVIANDKPTLILPFRDTLICSIDSHPLIAQGSATAYSWSPNYNIIHPNTANPIVFPKDTTVYTVTATDKGCVSTDSITVNVLDFITVSIIPDTTICASDSIRLSPVSYALGYQWSPATGLSSATVKNPLAAPASDITYQVLANLGKCQDKASIHIKVVPYPQAYAGADTSICYGGSAQLNGAIVASSFAWTPLTALAGSHTLYPVASPLQTTFYVLTVADTLGCPKLVRDTVVVNVTPKIIVFAGNDTSVVVGQPLQLNATSSDTTVTYSWSPLTYLSNAVISNPVITIYSTSVDSITYLLTATTPQGCYGTDDIKITVYKTKPDIFMPGAFTPNGDGRNDVFKPILVGITKLDFFKVFNRWGQLVYATTQNGSGWNGTLGGKQESTATFVYIVQGRDYLGNTITKKGTFILVR
jgi:gliding motility-associated-like protein